jgi:hypothetical protein
MIRLLLSCLICSAVAAIAAEDATSSPRSDTDILRSIKLPDGYDATVFAKPPLLAYPTSVSAAVDGTLFIAVDENGSLGSASNRGRVIRLRDVDGDGKADERKVFAEMDSPRGVIWDGPNGTSPGVLYVMHPPNLIVFSPRANCWCLAKRIPARELRRHHCAPADG